MVKAIQNWLTVVYPSIFSAATEDAPSTLLQRPVPLRHP